MITKFKNNWTKWHHIFHKSILADKTFIPNDSHLLVSVSGGQDSMALLTLLDDIKEQHNWSLSVWHGDHQWHQDSNNFANKLQNYCLEKKIIFYLDLAEGVDVSTEEKARVWRYKKLSDKALEIISNNQIHERIHIVTGHTSSDNTETFLLNLARGSDFAGLGGIPKKRLLNKKFFLTRPILIFSRNDTAAICKDLKVPFWEDPSNSDTKLNRNFIRHKIINQLEKIYPGCSHRINKFIQRMRNHHEERLDLCELAITSCMHEDEIKRPILNNLGVKARSTVLHFILSKRCSKQINSKNIDDLSEQIFKKEQGRQSFPNGMIIVWNKNFIQIQS